MKDYLFYNLCEALCDEINNLLKNNYYSTIEFDTNLKLEYLLIWEDDKVISAFKIGKIIKKFNTDDIDTLVNVFRPLLTDYM